MRKKINEKGGIDELDRQILSVLQEDCRLSFRKIAEKMHISCVKASSRIKNLEDTGIVKGYTVILDQLKLGYDLTTVIFIQTDGRYLEDLENDLLQIANVILLYEITGDFDLVAVARVKDRGSLNTLIKSLLLTPHIKKTMTSISLSIVKEDFKIKI